MLLNDKTHLNIWNDKEHLCIYGENKTNKIKRRTMWQGCTLWSLMTRVALQQQAKVSSLSGCGLVTTQWAVRKHNFHRCRFYFDTNFGQSQSDVWYNWVYSGNTHRNICFNMSRRFHCLMCDDHRGSRSDTWILRHQHDSRVKEKCLHLVVW